MPSLPRLAALGLALLGAGAARASSWRAVQAGAGPDRACVEVKETIDDFLASRIRLLPICRLSLDVVQLSRGFVIVCGAERGYILYRHEAACRAALSAARAQRVLTAAEAAPEGTASPERWLDTMVWCLPGVTEEVVAAGRVQARVGYCECVAGWAGSFGAGAALPRERTAWEGTIDRCSQSALGAWVPNDVLSGAATALMAALATPTAPISAAPAPSQPAPQGSVIRRGATYADVMAALREHPVEKVPAGDVLTATYASPALLAYPDAGGRCVLTFDRGRLDRCEGCDPSRFQCGR